MADQLMMPWRVVLKGRYAGPGDDPDVAFVAGFNNQPVAEKNAEERTEKGKAFKCKPQYEAIPCPV